MHRVLLDFGELQRRHRRRVGWSCRVADGHKWLSRLLTGLGYMVQWCFQVMEIYSNLILCCSGKFDGRTHVGGWSAIWWSWLGWLEMAWAPVHMHRAYVNSGELWGCAGLLTRRCTRVDRVVTRRRKGFSSKLLWVVSGRC